jgi:hypothetical protein
MNTANTSFFLRAQHTGTMHCSSLCRHIICHAHYMKFSVTKLYKVFCTALAAKWSGKIVLR